MAYINHKSGTWLNFQKIFPRKFFEARITNLLLVFLGKMLAGSLGAERGTLGVELELESGATSFFLSTEPTTNVGRTEVDLSPVLLGLVATTLLGPLSTGDGLERLFELS